MKAWYFAAAILALVACTLADGDGDNLGICTLPIDPGHVCSTSAEAARYGFDTKSNSCLSFTYLGCGGNSNNFDSLVECKKTCES